MMQDMDQPEPHDGAINPIVLKGTAYNPGIRKTDNETTFERLNQLADEISVGIVNLSGVKKELIQNELETLRTQSFVDRSPEITFITGLFRKYADIANQIKDNRQIRSINDVTPNSNTFGIIGEIPSLQQDEKDLVGWKALKTYIFWLRFTVCLLSFICYVVMSSVSYISYSSFNPASFFKSTCPYYDSDIEGSFNYRPYQMVIAVGVLLYLENLLLAIYYTLPVNKDNLKYIPGLSMVFGEENAQFCTHRTGYFCQSFFRFLEFFLDTVLLTMAVVTFLVASIILERSRKFTFNNNTSFYFSIGSFYNTFTNTTPSCIDNDPTESIRAALAMLFFATLVFALCFQVSFTAFREQMNQAMPPAPTTGKNSLSMSKTGGKISGEEFQQLPVTQDEEEVEYEMKL